MIIIHSHRLYKNLPISQLIDRIESKPVLRTTEKVHRIENRNVGICVREGSLISRNFHQHTIFTIQQPAKLIYCWIIWRLNKAISVWIKSHQSDASTHTDKPVVLSDHTGTRSKAISLFFRSIKQRPLPQHFTILRVKSNHTCPVIGVSANQPVLALFAIKKTKRTIGKRVVKYWGWILQLCIELNKSRRFNNTSSGISRDDH